MPPEGPGRPAAPAADALPVLHGIRVLDLGRYIAGPFCAALLGDLGAEVTRIERIDGGEDRGVTPVAGDGTGALFLQVNRNKRCIALDIARPEGQAVLRRQVAQADVVVANLPPPTLRRLGLDYETLAAIRPDIILTTTSAFGEGGPLGDRPGFDGVAQAMSGAMHLSGEPGRPAKLMVSCVDFATALAGAFGTLAALHERQRTGRGQQVSGSLLGTALTIANNALIEEALLHPGREAAGNRSPLGGPSDTFRVRDGWIIVQVMGDPLFRRWAALIGRPDLADAPRFATDQSRGDHGEELSALMAAWCAGHDVESALSALAAARIPCGPVLAPRQVLADPHIRASGAFRALDYPGLPQPAPIARPPVSLSRTPPTIRRRAPQPGEHTEAILAESGYDTAAIAALARAGIVRLAREPDAVPAAHPA
ncbi:CoA transferase [Roseomonas sp. NAR14]|uniref:CoA transferase n=1 Tax=Roseomonas acroporae TaxID=2937791 RepID=A0A9X1YDA9_9PROT|nr:CoA transferase [Roseomonas acroporae]MCK8788043.1 CoA transferase [Roseomonas acroporae]